MQNKIKQPASNNGRAIKKTASKAHSFRAKDEQIDIIKRAAKIQHQPYTAFMIAAAQEAATEIIEKHARTTLGSLEWEKLAIRLRETPKDIPALKTLLNKTPLWGK